LPAQLFPCYLVQCKVIDAMNRFIFSKISIVGCTMFALAVNGFAATTGQPTISIVAPTSGQHLRTDTAVVSGRASGNGGALAGVYVIANGTTNLAATAAGWKTWFTSVSMTPGTNVVRAYAINTNGKKSTTATVKFFYDTVTVSLAGREMAVTNGVANYTITFGTNTFSMSSDDFDFNRVGTYTNSKINGLSSKLKLTFIAPPNAKATNTVTLHFDMSSSGTFTNVNGDNSFSLDSTTNDLAPVSVAGTLTFQIDDGSTNVYSIPLSPIIAENPNPFKINNPLAIWIETPYPGNIGDRVSVKFTHLVWKTTQWVEVNQPVAFGTVVGTGTVASGTNTVNTVTVLFDAISIPSTDLFGPISGLPVNIWSLTETNYDEDGNAVTNFIGQFTYKKYSGVGALFTPTTIAGTSYDILNFTDDSDGDFFSTIVDFSGNTNTATGTFSFDLLSNSGGGGSTNNFSPSSVNGKTLTTTNGGFFEQVAFSSSTFNETNSFDAATNSGNYIYSQKSGTLATTLLSFTNGPSAGMTNVIFTIFTATNFGTFNTTNFDASGNVVTNYSGHFHLQ